MFQNLSNQLSQTLSQLTGRGKLNEKNIKGSLREVRMALLAADVALPIVKQLIKDITAEAMGQRVSQSLNPGQSFVKIVAEHLSKIMTHPSHDLNLRAKRPVVILMAGLQGSGKTTTSAKLAKWLIAREKLKVMLVSTDIYRPAAIEQLATVTAQVGAIYQPSRADEKPKAIANKALDAAQRSQADVLIVDTAGRTHIDATMMDEIQLLNKQLNPAETLFVVDSMMGQDAVNAAKSFNDALNLTGVVLTKTDGDARGGAALSIHAVTQKPIKFMGTGEHLDQLEAFEPERVAKRILGMGDVLSLIETLEQKTDEKQAKRMAKKIQKGKGLDLEDFLAQLQQLQSMGGMASLLKKIPGAQLPPGATDMLDEKPITKMKAAIQSMTPEERRNPEIIRAKRKIRIAKGSGTDVQDVNRLLKQFKLMQKSMKGLKGGKMHKMMGQMPPGFPPMGAMPHSD